MCHSPKVGCLSTLGWRPQSPTGWVLLPYGRNGVAGDEPTGALNAATAAEIMDLLAEVNREGRTVVLVTHDPNVASRAGRVLVLRDGLVDGDLRRNGSHTDDEWSECLAGWLTSHGT